MPSAFLGANCALQQHPLRINFCSSGDSSDATATLILIAIKLRDYLSDDPRHVPHVDLKWTVKRSVIQRTV